MILHRVDAGRVKDDAGETRGEHLNTLKRLLIGADKREEGAEVGIQLDTRQVSLVAHTLIRAAVKVAQAVVVKVAIVVLRLAEDGNYIILRLALTVLAQKTKRDRYRGLGHIVLPAALRGGRLNFYIFQFFGLNRLDLFRTDRSTHVLEKILLLLFVKIKCTLMYF